MTPFSVPAQPRLALDMLLPHRNGGGGSPVVAGGCARIYPLFWARSALYHGLHALGIGNGDTVLVPAYHCSAIVESVIHAGARAELYPIRADCLPDLVDLETRLAAGARALLVIHYFGFPQPLRRLRQLCDEYGAFLIEDCAHVLHSTVSDVELGSIGDISVFSWRKFLPLHDGAHLVVNRTNLDVAIPWARESSLLTLKILKDLLDRAVEGSTNGPAKQLASAWRLPARVGQYLLRRAHSDAQVLAVKNYGTDFDASTANLPMSGPSRYILRRLDLEAVMASRRANYLWLLDAVASLPGVTPLFADLPAGICPLAFPMRINGRTDLHVRLQARGVPAFTWGGVIHPQFSPTQFPESAALYQQLAWLPIHQSLTPGDLTTMFEVLADLLLHHRP